MAIIEIFLFDALSMPACNLAKPCIGFCSKCFDQCLVALAPHIDNDLIIIIITNVSQCIIIIGVIVMAIVDVHDQDKVMKPQPGYSALVSRLRSPAMRELLQIIYIKMMVS